MAAADTAEPEINYPAWTDDRKKNGLDPVGMQNSSVNLYQRYLPGISNVTLRMRYYGLYAWLCRSYALNKGSDVAIVRGILNRIIGLGDDRVENADVDNDQHSNAFDLGDETDDAEDDLMRTHSQPQEWPARQTPKAFSLKSCPNMAPRVRPVRASGAWIGARCCPKYVYKLRTENPCVCPKNAYIYRTGGYTMRGSSIDLKSRISRRIAGRSSAVWTPVDFLDLGPRDAVDKALQRLARAGELRRIDRGLYDRSRFNRLTGKPSVPDYRAIIDAIARRDQAAMLVDGMTAANDLGLSDAVPGQVVVHTAARLRPVRVGNLTIRFRLTAPSKLYWAGRPAMRVVQALHWLRDTLSRPEDRDHVLRRLRTILADPQHGAAIAADLADGLPTLPAWMQDIVRELLAEHDAEKGQSDAQRSRRQAGGAAPGRTKKAPSARDKRAVKETVTAGRLTQTAEADQS